MFYVAKSLWAPIISAMWKKIYYLTLFRYIMSIFSQVSLRPFYTRNSVKDEIRFLLRVSLVENLVRKATRGSGPHKKLGVFYDSRTPHGRNSRNQFGFIRSIFGTMRIYRCFVSISRIIHAVCREPYVSKVRFASCCGRRETTAFLFEVVAPRIRVWRPRAWTTGEKKWKKNEK